MSLNKQKRMTGTTGDASLFSLCKLSFSSLPPKSLFSKSSVLYDRTLLLTKSNLNLLTIQLCKPPAILPPFRGRQCAITPLWFWVWSFGGHLREINLPFAHLLKRLLVQQILLGRLGVNLSPKQEWQSLVVFSLCLLFYKCLTSPISRSQSCCQVGG